MIDTKRVLIDKNTRAIYLDSFTCFCCLRDDNMVCPCKGGRCRKCGACYQVHCQCDR